MQNLLCRSEERSPRGSVWSDHNSLLLGFISDRVVKISEPSHTKYTRFFPSLHDFLTVITVSDCIKMGWQNNT